MKQNYIDLKMPSIMGMGAVGPTLSVLTASAFSGLVAAVENPPHWAYPAIMFSLSALLAVFPVAKEKLPNWQKWALWPVVAVIIFSAAWGTNHGLSLGEEALDGKEGGGVSLMQLPSFISSAYAQEPTNSVTSATNMWRKVAGPDKTLTNKVDFSKVDFASRTLVGQNAFTNLPERVWSLSWPETKVVYLKDGKGTWYRYHLKKDKPEPEPATAVQERPQQQQKLHGGFFKRWK